MITTINARYNQELQVLFYRAAVDVSRSTLNYVASLIRRHRKVSGLPMVTAPLRAGTGRPDVERATHPYAAG
ncbi:hypothetical protein ACLQ2R_11465 [Streptosporangium sp. DT93]|uniref:hypothetical protein n=1 Tax=Streptosporangium sp. DT93 TaxID=3393428 RepID=UPI003CF2D318